MINIFYNLLTKISKTKTILKSEKYMRMNSYRGTEEQTWHVLFTLYYFAALQTHKRISST